MKALVAVMGGEVYMLNGMYQLMLDTWVKDVPAPADFRFFVGHGETVLTDKEWRVDVPDDKEHCLWKTVEICKWMLEHGYDMLLKVDADTYINVPEMMRQDLGYDYIGTVLGRLGEIYVGACESFIQGSAMWLSRKAAEIIVREAIPHMLEVRESLMPWNGIIAPYPHAEDLWIGQVLNPRVRTGEIRALADSGYSNGPLTFHFAICHSTCTQEEWQGRLDRWMRGLDKAKGDRDKMRGIHEYR